MRARARGKGEQQNKKTKTNGSAISLLSFYSNWNFRSLSAELKDLIATSSRNKTAPLYTKIIIILHPNTSTTIMWAMLGYSPRIGPAIRYTSCTVISYGSENRFVHGINKDILPAKEIVFTDDRI